MGSQEVQLLNFLLSPVGRRVEWALKLKGVDFEYVEEDIFNKSNLLLEMNPVHKKVPVLVHGHKPIAESLIILEYIDEIWKQYPLLPLHPYERAHARFWANLADEKLALGSWVALMRSSGDEQEKRVKEVREVMEKLEEEILGKKFFGGDNIGYLDLVLGWIPCWLPVWEEVGSMQVLDTNKCPAISAWETNFLSHPVIKDCLPPRDKLVAYAHRRREQYFSI
ncbi:glutathione transferase GST 23-like [Lotus japonicus]|uniref:glutathione transferase GST 23-like n=1 Tax=Lotus japonicus TaxID=34305 RepID=UPI00258C4A89|nr:glutathione transferase GST 23-like [Lotus japonicus]